MSKSPVTGPSKAELEELSLCLENRTFVDYFNTFLCLPVFGQHVFYNYMEMEFDFEPPLKNRRHLYLDRIEVLKWLCTERLRLFKRSALYTEYRLCMLLRDTSVELPGVNPKEEKDKGTFIRNVIGTAMGMLLFRESMRGTCGETVYRCWKDIEAWRCIEDLGKKMYWKHVINTQYVSQNSTMDVNGKVFHGMFNFDLVPEDDVHQQMLAAAADDTYRYFVGSDEALLKLQKILLDALRNYWLPRHLLHILTTTNKDALDILLKPAPGDVEYLNNERRLRCHYRFPTIYQDSSINSPISSVFMSRSADELPNISSVSPSSDDSDLIEDDEANINPIDLLSLWGGPAKEIRLERGSPSMFCSSLPEIESLDELSNRIVRSASAATRMRSPIPIVLTSYLGGKERTLLGKFPQTTSRVIWSLASDTLACCPFREFLERNDQPCGLKYLSFWTDVRNYLDTDEHNLDGYGKPLRRLLSHKIANTYLSREGEGCDILSETLKMSLFTALSTNNDVSLLCTAQDIIQESLLEPLKLYIQEERRNFSKQVRGLRYQLDIKQRRAMDHAVKVSNSKFASNPMYFFNCVTIDANSASSESPPISPFSPPTTCLSAMSGPGTSYHVCITEERMWKAMEIAVLCSEYGVSMMIPQSLPKPEHLVDVLQSDYGSLHVSRVAVVRHEWLKSLLEKPKINIEAIKVSRKVILDIVDIASIKRKYGDKETDAALGAKARRVRRHGLTLDRPTKPRSILEVMSNHVQFDFFKRFMMLNKMGDPVLFCKAVEDLKNLSSKSRQVRVAQIVRKFFGKQAKYGAILDCDEDIIRQIPHVEKMTPGILICAQAAVLRTLERKWFFQYLETFPPESGSTSTTTISFSLQKSVPQDFEMMPEIILMKSKMKNKTLGKTKLYWKNVIRCLVNFSKSVTGKIESQLFEMFLKYMVEKEKNNALGDQMTSQVQPIEKNIMMSSLATNVQTRVVIRNRLVMLNRLPSDLRFWTEVKKFQDLVDSAKQKECMSSLDLEFLNDKARSIITCYLSSDIMPKVQVNIPNDMATLIINSFAASGPIRGLFHDAIVLIFPILYHFHRKFSEDWMRGNIPDEYFDRIECIIKHRVATSPHSEKTMPDYIHLRPDQFKTGHHLTVDEGMMRIQFTLSEGASYIFPQVKVQDKLNIGYGRRMVKQSVHALNVDTSRKGSVGGHGDKREKYGKRAVKSRDKLFESEETGTHSYRNIKERKKSEKIVVKETDLLGRTSLEQGKQPSFERSQRLSTLVDTLNKEKEEKIKEQNRRFSKLMSFGEVVSAALAEIPE